MRTVILGLCLAVMGCGSVGPSQTPVPEQPIRMVDAGSGTEIKRVLVVPKYGSSTGIATGGGHGPGYMLANTFLAFPFVYESGQVFRMMQPDSRGVMVGNALFAGRGIMIDGVVIIAPGYKPRFFGELWDRESYIKVSLEPVETSGAVAVGERLQNLLAKSHLKGSDLSEEERRAFSLGSDSSVALRFSEEERKLLRAFLSTAKRVGSSPAAKPSRVGQLREP